MTAESSVPAGSDAAPAFDLPADAPEEFSSVNDALGYLSSLDEKRKTAEAPEATADPELSKDNADPEKAPSEEPDADEPDADPPIDPPRSWTKEEKEEFATYPREAQEKIARREQERETNLRRSQNDIADQRKAIEAERQKAEQARQNYESKLTNTVKIMEDALQAEFGDIQTMQDVRKLQSEDPFRFQAWQVRQMELTAAKSETMAAEQRQAQEKQSKRAAYESEQNHRLVEMVPEMGDPKKADALRTRAVNMLTDDLGLKTDQLSRWMTDDTGHEILSNAGIQKLIADGLKYQAIMKAPKAIPAKSVPPVQRPGVSKPAGSDASEREQALSRKTELTQKEGLELLGLQSNRRRA